MPVVFVDAGAFAGDLKDSLLGSHPVGLDQVSLDGITVFASMRLDTPEALAAELDTRGPWTEPGLVARAYLKWGERFPEHLSGDFAVVLWDGRQRRLVACRDPFGVRSLFYRRAPKGVWFSRDQEALLRTFDLVPALNDDRVVEHLLGIFAATDRTFFEDVHQVPAGQMVVFREQTSQSWAYWTPPAGIPDRRSPQPTAAFLEEFGVLLRRSVANRLHGCAAAVVHISGGVDSSAIAVAANQIARNRAEPLTLVGANASYPGLSCDETAYVQALEPELRFPVRRWEGTRSVALDLTSPAIDGPAFRSAFADGTLGDIDIAQRQEASVILSGTGGDELTVGAGTAKDMLAHHEWGRAANRVLFYEGPDGKSVLNRLRRLASQYLPASLSRYRAIRRFAMPSWMTPLSRGRVSDIVVGHPSPQLDSAASSYVWNRLNSPQLVCGVETLQRHAAPFGIEYRFPLLDRDLVRFVVSAAAGYWPLRTRPHQRAMYRMLPGIIGDRVSKADLTPAFANRITRAAPLIERQFSDGVWASAKYVARDAAFAAWRTFDPRRADGVACRRLWSVVTLEAWLRRVFGYISPP